MGKKKKETEINNQRLASLSGINPYSLEKENEIVKTLSDEIMNDGLGYDGLIGVKPIKKHLQEFKEEFESLICYMNEGAYCLLCKEEKPTNHEGLCVHCILKAQMQKHFGDKLNGN